MAGDEIDRDAYSRYHETLVVHLKKAESDFTNVLVPLLSAVSGYGYALLKVLDKNGPNHPGTILTVAALGAIGVLVWTLFYALVLAYNYRDMQIVVGRLEIRLGLSQVLPRRWAMENKIGARNVLTTIFQFHVTSILLAITSIASVHGYVMTKFFPPACSCPYVALFWGCLVALIFFALRRIVFWRLDYLAGNVEKDRNDVRGAGGLDSDGMAKTEEMG